jgi:hypothetical protein
MPLDAQNEVRRGSFARLAAFYGFYDAILRASRGDTEAVPGDADGLVVAGVDGEPKELVLFRGFFRVEERAQEGVGGYGG